jgi:hypothetical protein
MGIRTPPAVHAVLKYVTRVRSACSLQLASKVAVESSSSESSMHPLMWSLAFVYIASTDGATVQVGFCVSLPMQHNGEEPTMPK